MHRNRLVFSDHKKKSISGSLLGTILIITGVTTINAQQVTRLNLHDALQTATENNRFVQKAAIEKHITKENVKEKKELRLPDVELHSLYSRITNLTEFQSGFLQGKQVTKTIPEIYDVSASFRMPLYAGNKIRTTIKIAEKESELAELKAEKTANDVKLRVVASFLNIYKMMELQGILSESIKEEKERLKEVQSFKKHGTVTKNEVLSAELQLSDRELDSLTNQKNIAIALHDLKTILQLREEQQIELDTTQLLSALHKGETYEFFLKEAMNNEEMKMAGKEVEIGMLEKKRVRANYFPVISLFGNYSFKYPNYMFFPPDPYLYSLGQVGVEATFNLSNLHKNKTKSRLADQQLEKQKMEAGIIKDAVEDAIFADYTHYQETRARIPVTDKALALATENYRIVKLKYLNQLVLITEMIDADNALLEARFKNTATKIDAVMKYYELLHTADMLH
ncbi:TolC family protein [Flavobacterium cerinum]|uniref:TolC family protein n=1 Tax=Flavobacterium cerinum TaxID=2502784 RepID=A0ABY5IVX2_9FLAO|nr:TolC family protein [Flavobacterium cerinum]UUC45903.1 TolC family protein [Flavobacterium cerinum]